MPWKSLVLAVASASIADGSALAADHQSCFYISQFETWKAPDAKTIYIRVSPRRYYRLDLAAKCPAIVWPDAHLVTTFRGSANVCTALDWDLKVSETPQGITQGCVVKSMTELTPAEADAIPKKFKP
jgi:Family of unknown function (DUF6491)